MWIKDALRKLVDPEGEKLFAKKDLIPIALRDPPCSP
jgi:hypothetical protein